LIRQARLDDLDAVARIFCESRAEAMPWLPVLHGRDDVRDFYAGRLAGDELYVCERAGRVVGWALLAGAELDGFYVAPEAQRQGVGAELLRHVQELRPGGFGFWVFSDNDRARRFYESHGARLLYETDGANNEERVADARYEWTPSPERAEA
jgi:GNAT superfamily N-acetyltransferase